MLLALLLLLIVLWGIGLLPQDISIPNVVFFTINGRGVTFWDFITLIVITWVIGLLPSPFQAIASVLLVLWLLSIFGILAIGGLSSLLILCIIVGLAFYLVAGIAHYGEHHPV